MALRGLRHFELQDVPVARPMGRLIGVSGLLLHAVGCQLQIGQRCQIEVAEGDWMDAQVVGFRHEECFLMPLRKTHGLLSGARVLPKDSHDKLCIGPEWLGRVVNGLGEPLDGKGPLQGSWSIDMHARHINPLTKAPVREVLEVGVRAIDAALTLGKGQRVGLMAGSGVGKSVLLGMMTRNSRADVVVVGLIGERGREVAEFIEQVLGASGLEKAILIVAPADESPLMRLMAAELCHSVASEFRDQGHHVLLLMDSLTRYAMAQREVALSLGEPPATRGYPPSVFSMLPRLVESAGNSDSSGSMSAIYTVLAEGDDQNDPIVDTARAILDGHIVLSRQLADRGHYPAIDITRSVSRCMSLVCDAQQLKDARLLKALISRYEQIRDLIPLGGYVAGADAMTDRAVSGYDAIESFLCQSSDESDSWQETRDELRRISA
ncbi:FliI/YscN family ATPase [Chromobacterium haemolyticum]|uniref:FliI/YscN family ATPase n=1 Tax=Chromobacterium haemolyticum TaxID=394935 RepID=UPI0009DA3482|nr:FliI/YscN family ATPase [Chromobacterium haemolyticum]OQS33878.1 flagellum-specific ATP synthase FliI [Chromobacterium haemolyticum]